MTRQSAPIMSRAQKAFRRQGVHESALATGRKRVMIAGALFALCFVVLGGRLVDLALEGRGRASATPHVAREAQADRANIVDRNGVILATSLKTASLYANARIIPNPAEAAKRIVSVLPELDVQAVREKLASKRSFVWLKRKLSPRQQWAVNRLGIPGLSFKSEEKRIYPQGRMASHVVGFVNVDNRGMSGLERRFDDALADPVAPDAVATTLDSRVQHALYSELAEAMATFEAKGAGGIVMDVKTGEVVGLASLPAFDPHKPADAPAVSRFNRVTQGVYEMGSPFKAFTIAAALESGAVTVASGYDASKPIHVARYTIRDFHAENRYLTVPEIFLHSSNIGAAKIALDLGGEAQQAFFRKLGLFRTPAIELSEVGAPIYPDRWREVNTMTAAFGHGVAVSPLQLAVAMSAIVNGGVLRPATLVDSPERRAGGQRIISEGVSRTMRDMMRLVVEQGTGEKAQAAGYVIGGKTGTSEKPRNGGYDTTALISSFVGVFPGDSPRYLVLAMLDEPKGIKDTFGYATGGWTAAPVVSRVVARIGPILGIYPQERRHTPESPAILAALDGRSLPGVAQ